MLNIFIKKKVILKVRIKWKKLIIKLLNNKENY